MHRPSNVRDAIALCPVLSTDASAAPSDAADVWARARKGELVRILSGAWAPRLEWGSLWPEHQHAIRALAAWPRLRDPSAVISHHSAAALRGWSIDAPFPDRVHVTLTATATRWANRTFVAHTDPGPVEVDPTGLDRYGLRMTTGARTAADLALVLPFRDGVAILDQALRVEVTRASIRAELDRRPRRGSAKAGEALAFADPGAANVGESALRVVFRDLGFPPPVTQREFRDGTRRAFVDFWFPDAGVIVEFDGRGKYVDPSLTQGRSAAEVVLAEKDREDWLRSFPETRGFVRLGPPDLRRPDVVRMRCERAGIRPVRDARAA